MAAAQRSRFSLFALGFMTAAAAGACIVLLVFIDPADASVSTWVVLYASIFTAVMGIAAWVFLVFRGRFATTKRPLVYFFTDAVRQGAIIAALLTGSLFLQAQRNLTVVFAIGLIALAFVAEALAVRIQRRSA